MLKDKPIQSKLMTIMLLTSGAALLITFTAYFFYELTSYRKTMVDNLTVIGEMTAYNTTAALIFKNEEDAREILSALKADRHITEAILYDSKQQVFAHYPDNKQVAGHLPDTTRASQFHFQGDHLIGTLPVVFKGRALGWLYIRSDVSSLYDTLRLYAIIALGVTLLAFVAAYVISKIGQKKISNPILNLASMATIISNQKDYSMRAVKYDNDEVGILTDAFNEMLEEIESQNNQITWLNQTLEQTVAERTRQLELAYKDMESFSYSVSHDLSAPLRHIDSFITLFMNRHGATLDQDGSQLLNRAITNTRKMRQLIDDLLAFSRTGRKSLEKTRVYMKDIVALTWKELIRHENGRDIKISIGSLPRVLIDVPTMKQVWSNLLANALKYTRAEKETIITIDVQERHGEYIFSIHDNGAGFDEQYKEKLFQPFQRLHTQQEFEGTGIGLAIVERIVSRHGGRVWAESRKGEGATFYFTIPR